MLRINHSIFIFWKWEMVDAVSDLWCSPLEGIKKSNYAIKTKTKKHPNLISYRLMNLIEALVYH